jgi:hypothetical protein
MVMMIDECVMTMTGIHLTCLRAQLISFRPIMFGRLPMEVTCAFHICTTEAVHAIFTVALDVHCWDDPSHPFYRVHEVRKVLDETLFQVYAMLARTVI